MIMNRKYGVSALKKENLYLINYGHRGVEKFKILEDIIDKYVQGIHIISGMKGTGKSTFLNLLEDRNEKNRVFLHLNILDSSFDLVSEITIFLDNLINTESIENANESKLENIDKYKERLNKLKYKLFNEILIKKSFQARVGEKETSKVQRKFGIDIKKYMSIDLSANNEIEENQKNEFIYEMISTPIQKQEKNVKELISILKELSEYYGIIIILDEIDKVKDDEFDKLLEKNKELFLESGIVYFLVCDNKKYINIRYNKIYSDMFNRYIYLPLLSWKEYLITAPKIKEFRDVNTIKMSYCYTIGNYRRIVTFQNNDEFNKYSEEFWDVFNEIESSDFYINLPEPFQDIIKEFILDILIELKINLYLTDEEIQYIKEKHSFIRIVSNSIDRIIEILHKSKYINYIEGKYTLNEDNKEREFLYNSEDTLENEVIKLYQVKKDFVRLKNEYRIEKLSTPEINSLFDMIVWCRTNLDAVLIFREKTTTRNINDISYHAVLLVSDEFYSTAFVNIDGFSWNHECGVRYGEMKEYLNKRNILYKEYELNEDEDVSTAFDRRQRSYIKDLKSELNKN